MIRTTKTDAAKMLGESKGHTRAIAAKNMETPLVHIIEIKTGKKTKAYLGHAKRLVKEGKAKIVGFVK